MGDIVVVADSESEETTAEVVAEAVADAVAEAVADAPTEGVTEVDLSTEHRLTVLELAVSEAQAAIMSLGWKADDAQMTADAALAEAEAAPDLAAVEDMIESTEFKEGEDGEIEADAPDVPPSGTGTSILFDSFSGLKSRFGKKVAD